VGYRQKPPHPGQSSFLGAEEAHDLAPRNATTRLGCPTRQPSGSIERQQEGQHSIRINDQFRICFVWADRDAYDVEIIDYH
jgi:proteic killer suppression protein